MTVGSNQIMNFEERIIKDTDTIKRYDEEFKYRFYQPKYEENWLDPNIVSQSTYHDSRESINYVFDPIYVSVNDKDEMIDDPVQRVHGRILDGRQRYADSKRNKKPWPVVYVYIKNYKEFLYVMATMGSKKDRKVQGLQTQSIIRSICELTWKEKPKEIYNTDGFPDRQLVSTYVTNLLSKRWAKITIMKAIPMEYKNKVKVEAGQQIQTTVKPKSKMKQENMNLRQEVDRLMKYVDDLEKRVMPEDKKDEMIKRQEYTIKQLRIILGIIKSDMRQARKLARIDQSTKDFLKYWESATEEKRMYQ